MPGLPTRGNYACLTFRAVSVMVPVQHDWGNGTAIDVPPKQGILCP